MNSAHGTFQHHCQCKKGCTILHKIRYPGQLEIVDLPDKRSNLLELKKKFYNVDTRKSMETAERSLNDIVAANDFDTTRFDLYKLKLTGHNLWPVL
jgi:hypothetical protein